MPNQPKKLTNASINRLQFDVKKYFRAYYAELRKQLADHPEAIRHWFRGGRRIITTICKDGIVIVHQPYDLEQMTYPDNKDTYLFEREPDLLVKVFIRRYDLPSGSGDKLTPLISDYTPGEDFGAYSWLEPRQLITPLDNEGTIMSHEERPWSRLDYVSLFRLDTYRNIEEARAQARYVVRPYISNDTE